MWLGTMWLGKNARAGSRTGSSTRPQALPLAIDMSLAGIETLLDTQAADGAAIHSEYVRMKDPGNDPFALHFGIK